MLDEDSIASLHRLGLLLAAEGRHREGIDWKMNGKGSRWRGLIEGHRLRLLMGELRRGRLDGLLLLLAELQHRVGRGRAD